MDSDKIQTVSDTVDLSHVTLWDIIGGGYYIGTADYRSWIIDNIYSTVYTVLYLVFNFHRLSRKA